MSKHRPPRKLDDQESLLAVLPAGEEWAPVSVLRPIDIPIPSGNDSFIGLPAEAQWNQWILEPVWTGGLVSITVIRQYDPGVRCVEYRISDEAWFYEPHKWFVPPHKFLAYFLTSWPPFYPIRGTSVQEPSLRSQGTSIFARNHRVLWVISWITCDTKRRCGSWPFFTTTMISRSRAQRIWAMESSTFKFQISTFNFQRSTLQLLSRWSWWHLYEIYMGLLLQERFETMSLRRGVDIQLSEDPGRSNQWFP